jgi:DNA-binding NarL/FixJ family response regulator
MRAVAGGEAIFGPRIGVRMMNCFTVSRSAIPQEVLADLTDREREVRTLIACGESNAGAETLTISIKEVRNHVSNILSKLQAAVRTQAVIRAREAGLGQRLAPCVIGSRWPLPRAFLPQLSGATAGQGETRLSLLRSY